MMLHSTLCYICSVMLMMYVTTVNDMSSLDCNRKTSISINLSIDPSLSIYHIYLYISISSNNIIQKIILSTSAKSIESSDNAVLIQLIREVSTSLARFAVPKLKLWRSIFENSLRIYNADIIILRNDDVLIDDNDDNHDDDDDLIVANDRKRKHSSTGGQITTDYTKRSSSSFSSDHHQSSSRRSNNGSSITSSISKNNSKMTTTDKIPTITQHVSLKTLMDNKMKCIQCIDQIKALLDQLNQLLTGKCKTFLKQ